MLSLQEEERPRNVKEGYMRTQQEGNCLQAGKISLETTPTPSHLNLRQIGTRAGHLEKVVVWVKVKNEEELVRDWGRRV